MSREKIEQKRTAVTRFTDLAEYERLAAALLQSVSTNQVRQITPINHNRVSINSTFRDFRVRSPHYRFMLGLGNLGSVWVLLVT